MNYSDFESFIRNKMQNAHVSCLSARYVDDIARKER